MGSWGGIRGRSRRVIRRRSVDGGWMDGGWMDGLVRRWLREYPDD